MLVRASDGSLETFMLRRSARSEFLPEMFVFPGGAVENGDVALAQSHLLRTPASQHEEREPSEPAFEVAALREAFEESGILIAARRDGSALRVEPDAAHALRSSLLETKTSFVALLDELGAVLDARALLYFSHWVTPPQERRRFDTHFYLAVAPEEQHGSADEIETHHGVWIAPAEALRRNAAGEFPLIFPTIKHLERLAAHDTLEALRAYAATKSIRVVHPVVEQGRHFGLPEDVRERW